MTDHEAKHILDKHTLMFVMWENNQSIPDASHGAIQEVLSAYKHFNPDYHMDACCSSCVGQMVELANAKRKELILKFYTFPKDEHTTN